MKQPEFQIGQTIELTIDRVRMGNTPDSWIVVFKDALNPNAEFHMPLPTTWKREDVKRGLVTRCRIQQFRGRFINVCLDASSADKVDHPEWGYFDDYVSKQSEGAELEKKTSIVFDPATRRADIQQQLGFTIMKEIASFANQRGGYIYFGIHDSDTTAPIRGIHGDFQEVKRYGERVGRHYGASVDGYMLVIQDFAKQRLGAGILGLLDFDPLITAQGLIVLRLYVKPCRGSTPVWYEDERLFVREGPRCDEKRGTVKTEFLNSWGDHLAKLPPPETDSKDALYFSIHDDGSISMRERKRAGHEITHRIYVTKGAVIPGHLLLVFSNGSLVFLDPNHIQKEIKENKGFARYRIPDGLRVVAAFYFVDPIYLLVVVLWQGELDGFKFFNPLAFFDGDVVTETPQRFLSEAEMELRECLMVSDGNELDSFVALHPLLKQSESGSTAFRKDLSRPDPSDFGHLIQDVVPKLYTDLLQFARTGHYPTISPHVRKDSAGYLTVSCATWETYKMVVREQLPESPLLTAEDIAPSTVSLYGFEWNHSPSKDWRSWHQAFSSTGQKLLFPPYSALEKARGIPRTGDVLFVFASGAMRRMSWTTCLSRLDDTTQALYLQTREPLRAVYYCHPGDYLVVLLDVPDLETPAFLFIPTCEIPLQSRILLPVLVGGKAAIQRTRTILGTGILYSDTISKSANNLRDFWNDWPREDPRCPITGFSPQIWNQFRSARKQAIVSHLRNGKLDINMVVPGVSRPRMRGKPLIDEIYPSLQWVKDCPELSEVSLTFLELSIPRELMKLLKPEVVEKLNVSAQKDNIKIVISDKKPILLNQCFCQFLHNALIMDENSQTVELRLSPKMANYKLCQTTENQEVTTWWEEDSTCESPN